MHVPLGAVLGITDALGELVGHGRLDPDQLQQNLLASPRLRAVLVDEQGVPVSVDDTVHVPPRDGPTTLRATLLSLRRPHLDRGSPRTRTTTDHPWTTAAARQAVHRTPVVTSRWAARRLAAAHVRLPEPGPRGCPA